jgi:hypothetical protein
VLPQYSLTVNKRCTAISCLARFYLPITVVEEDRRMIMLVPAFCGKFEFDRIQALKTRSQDFVDAIEAIRPEIEAIPHVDVDVVQIPDPSRDAVTIRNRAPGSAMPAIVLTRMEKVQEQTLSDSFYSAFQLLTGNPDNNEEEGNPEAGFARTILEAAQTVAADRCPVLPAGILGSFPSELQGLPWRDEVSDDAERGISDIEAFLKAETE